MCNFGGPTCGIWPTVNRVSQQQEFPESAGLASVHELLPKSTALPIGLRLRRRFIGEELSRILNHESRIGEPSSIALTAHEFLRVFVVERRSSRMRQMLLSVAEILQFDCQSIVSFRQACVSQKQ